MALQPRAQIKAPVLHVGPQVAQQTKAQDARRLGQRSQSLGFDRPEPLRPQQHHRPENSLSIGSLSMSTRRE